MSDPNDTRGQYGSMRCAPGCIAKAAAYQASLRNAAYGLPPVVPTGKTDYKIGTGGTVVLAAAVVAIVGIGVIGTKMKVRFW